jgi:hypothetical protein
MRGDYCSTCGKSTKGNGRSDLWSFRNILVGLLIIAAAMVIASNYQHRQDETEVRLLSGTVNVGPGGFYYVSFHLNNTARIVGRFQASGGSNDIQAVIADADEFENWKNGHAARLIYQTDRTTVGKIDSLLRPGDYYLGFNNQFSLLTSKTITGDIRVRSYY